MRASLASKRAIEAVNTDKHLQVASFIHIPLLARDATPQRAPRITLEQLVDAGEAMLVEMVKLARRQRQV